MSERRGNRFYPHPGLSAEGTLSRAIARIERQNGLERIRRTLGAEELRSVFALVDLCAFKEDWEKIAEVASRTILEGCGRNARTRLYRAWIEALRNMHDVGGIQSLGKHLLALRGLSEDFVSLALMAFCYAGRMDHARRLFRSVRARTVRNAPAYEACAVYLCEFSRHSGRETGLRIMERLAFRREAQYFQCRNFLVYALELDALDAAQRAFERLHARFPRCPQPYWGAAVVAVYNGAWGEAATSLQELLADNPENTDAILALARCLEMTGDLMAARELLTANAALFDYDDYEFHAAGGVLNERLFERYGMSAYRKSSVRHFAAALRIAPRLGVPEAPLHLSLKALGAGVGEQSFQVASPDPSSAQGTPKYWVLSLDDERLRGVVKQRSFIARSPTTMADGDVVFLSRIVRPSREPNAQHIVGVMSALTPSVPDCRYGCAIRMGDIQVFEMPVDVELPETSARARDAQGLENFSREGQAHFISIDRETADSILHELKTVNVDSHSKERARHAG